MKKRIKKEDEGEGLSMWQAKQKQNNKKANSISPNFTLEENESQRS